MTTQSFFSGLLAPSLLSLSPLQSIIRFLQDADITRFCHLNNEHQSIFTRMRLLDFHALKEQQWYRIAAKKGPIVTAITLDGLSELTHIPEAARGQIRRISFQDYTSESESIARSDLPPLLEELTTHDNIVETWLPELMMNEMPILPESLKKLKLAHSWKKKQHGDDDGEEAEMDGDDEEEEDKPERPSQFIKRILSQAQSLTDVEMNVHEVEVIAALPASVTRLNIHLNCFQSPQSESDWPRSLRHLTIDAPSLDELSPILPPRTLESLELPEGRGYQHYEATLQKISEMSQLQSIVFGDGIHIDTTEIDIFALLPRSLTSLTCKGRDIKTQCSLHNCVHNLPDSLEILHFALPNTPVTRWPASLRRLDVPNPSFLQDLSSLPATVEVLNLSQTYSRTISRWPSHLTTMHLGVYYSDLESLQKLPASLRGLAINVVMVRKLMERGKLPPSLTWLGAYGIPESSRSFDLRLLPKSLNLLYFDGGFPSFLGRKERSDISLPRVSLTSKCRQDVTEMDLELSDMIMTELVPQMDANAEVEESTVTAGPFAVSHPITEYELDYASYAVNNKKCTNSNEAIARLTSATKENPIVGVSLTRVVPNPFGSSPLEALKKALHRGAISGPFALCHCANGQNNPFSAAKQDSPLTEIMQALPHSNLTKIKLDNFPGKLSEEEYATPSSPEFAAFCTSLTHISTLRTIVLRGYSEFANQSDLLRHLIRALLTPECAPIESLDISESRFESEVVHDNMNHIVELIRHSRTLKHLALSRCGIGLRELWQLCQAVAIHSTLITLNVAGNRTSLAGLHALRWTLRQNRTIEITVCRNDFGDEGIALFYQYRHARLKESSGYYFDHHILGPEIELP